MILDDSFEPLLSLSFPLSCNCLVTWGEIPLWAEMTRTVSSLPNFFNYGGLDSDTYSLRILKCAKNVESYLRFTSKGHPSESDHHTVTIFWQKHKKAKKKYWSVLRAVDLMSPCPVSSIRVSERILTQNLCIFLPKCSGEESWCHFVLYPSRGGH